MITILNKLLRWDFIHWNNGMYEGNSRVRKTPDGTVYYYEYWTLSIIKTITEPKQVIWLTCSPDKYLPCKLKT